MVIQRRQLITAAAAGGALALAGCSPQADQPSFKAIDITGADYAQDFELPDTDGKIRHMADFKGQVVVVFFGFTQCPDVCPTSLAEMAQAKKLLGADGARVRSVFITVDPERDTPELLKAYVGNFGSDFVALRGTPEAIKATAKNFKVYYARVPGSTPDTYTMDHTAGSYVFDTHGKIRLFTRYGVGAQALVDDFKILLAQG